MSDRDDLSNWVGGDQQENLAARVMEPPRRRSRSVATALLGLAVLVGMGAVGYFIAQRQADTETSTNEDVAAPTVDSDSTDAASADDEATDDEATDDEATDEADDALTVAVEESGGEDGADANEGESAGATGGTSARTAVFRGGKLYLGGAVPSQEVADFITEKAASVVGPDNVVAEYEIDPSVVIDPGESTPLYVEDVVLFRFNSIEIDPPFLPLLDLGTLLLSQNPQATLTVVTRTDAVGSEAINIEVATKRAGAVIDYWLGKGVDADQLKSDPRGEEGTSDSDDEETAALQRRAEFIITGLLD